MRLGTLPHQFGFSSEVLFPKVCFTKKNVKIPPRHVKSGERHNRKCPCSGEICKGNLTKHSKTSTLLSILQCTEKLKVKVKGKSYNYNAKLGLFACLFCLMLKTL